MIEIGLLFGVIIVLLLNIYWKFKRPPNFPPGPKPLPIIGNALQLPKGHLFTVIDEFKKDYGPIIGFMAFGRPMVWMDGVDIIHAALRREEFQSRPDFFTLKARTFGKNLDYDYFYICATPEDGIFIPKHVVFYYNNLELLTRYRTISVNQVMFKHGSTVLSKSISSKVTYLEMDVMCLFFCSGDQWASSRKFTIKHLRAFGKNEKENVIIDEVNQLMETIKDDEVVQADGLFGVTAVNVIWMMMANKRVDLKDKKGKEFLHNLGLMFRQGSPTGGGTLENFVPIFRFVSSNFKFSQKITHNIQQYIRETIQEHREVLDPKNPLDLIDSYLVEIEQHKNSPESLYTEEDLISVGLDMFSAGAESTSNSIEFVLLYMVLYPAVQAKMQEELDRVLGRARRPRLDDKTEMHYTMAVITEVERLNSIAATNVPHTTTKDATFNGYFIPKGTMMVMNMRSLGSDPQYWKDHPEDFNPERFLDADGKFVKPSHLTTFGLGQRSCVGEVFARNTIFIATATFFEKFTIITPLGDPKPSTVPLGGFTTAPQPFRIKITSRY